MMLQAIAGWKPIIITSPHAPFYRPEEMGSLMEKLQSLVSSAIGQEATPKDTIFFCKELKDTPQILTIADQILKGKFSQEEVEEVPEGFRIKDTILSLSLRQVVGVPPDLGDHARLSLISSLSDLGYRVGMLTPDPNIYTCASPNFLAKAEQAGIDRADFIYMEAPKGADCNLCFPRDQFVQIGNTVHINPDSNFYWNRLYQWAGEHLKMNFSRIGLGGEVVIGENYAFLCQPFVPLDLGEMPYPIQREAENLEASIMNAHRSALGSLGIKVYELPPGWIDIFPPSILEALGTKKRFLIPIDHADLSVLHLPKENALFFLEPYYRENKDLVDRIIDEIKPDIFATLPDEDGLPINSLPLPNGGVFIDKAAQRSYKIFQDLGIEVKTTSEPFGRWAWGHQGGIHCATNTIWLPPTD